MRKETITQHLLRRLDTSAGMHSRIAMESGVSQATISRIFLRKVSPRLDIAEPILAWFDRQDKQAERKKSAPRVSISTNAGRRRAATGTATALSQ